MLPPSPPVDSRLACRNLVGPLLESLRHLGHSATFAELEETLVERQDWGADVTEVLYDPRRGSATTLRHRLSLILAHLGQRGVVQLSARDVLVLASGKQHQVGEDSRELAALDTLDACGIPGWRAEVTQILSCELRPTAFDVLMLRLLRESGLTHLQCSRHYEDGGFDGLGQVRWHPLASASMAYRCRRFRTTITDAEVREFRGTLPVHADKALFLSSGAFSRAAALEARRPGALQIQLIDGDAVAYLLQDFQLGVSTLRHVTVDRDFFDQL